MRSFTPVCGTKLRNDIYLDAGSVFGELWKLEPLSEERKKKWELEMDWLLSPTNYMIELVPAKQNGSNGSILEVILITDFVMMITLLPPN